MKDPVWSKIIAAALIALFGTLWALWPEKKTDESNSENSQGTIRTEWPLSDGKLPYLDKVPILDKTLYIEYSYNDFLVGGKNISKINVAARTSEGTDAEVHHSSYPCEFKTDIHDKPYIEFEYSEKFYSIEILGDMFNYSYILREIPRPTMDLELMTC